MKQNLIAIFEEQLPLLDVLSDSQVRRLINAMSSTFIRGKEVDMSDDILLHSLWPSFRGPMERLTGRQAEATTNSDESTNATLTVEDAKRTYVENVVLNEADYCLLVQFLNQPSEKLSLLQQSILLDMLAVRRKGCRVCEGQPFIYTESNYKRLGACFDDMKKLREMLEKEPGLMWHDIMVAPKKGLKYTRYFLNEAELKGFVESNLSVEPEIEVKEEPKPVIIERPVKPSVLRLCYDDNEPEVMEPEADLAFKVEDFVTPTDLTNDEQTLLYLLNEASKVKSRQMVGNKFVCTQDYLTSKMNKAAASNIQNLRESLVEKGYIQTERRSWYDGYIYKIIKYPDFLKNKAS